MSWYHLVGWFLLIRTLYEILRRRARVPKVLVPVAPIELIRVAHTAPKAPAAHEPIQPVESFKTLPISARQGHPLGSTTAKFTVSGPLRKQPSGIIISSRASPPLPKLTHTSSPKHGLMAPLRRKKILVCFGCGKKSGIKYDGQMTRWDCSLCESPNFLDENGEITDPPTETFSKDTVSVDRSYAVARNTSYLPPQGSRFCESCLKNQHLNNASMRQLDIELDLSRPGFGKQEEAAYEAAKERIEKRYPQVCEDCQAGVLEGIKKSIKWAQSDDLGRRLEKTRNSALKKPRRYGTLDVGRLLWYAGLRGCVLWSVSSAFNGLELDIAKLQDIPVVSTLFWLIHCLMHIMASDSWILASLACTVSSCWWNPYISKSSTVHQNNINGLQNWYKFQIFTIATRSIAWWLIGTGFTTEPNETATICSHLVLILVNVFLAHRAFLSLSIEIKPLWGSTPTRFKYVAGRSGTPPDMDDMSSQLNNIFSSTSHNYHQNSPTSPSLTHLQLRQSSNPNMPTLPTVDLPPQGSSFAPIPQDESNNYGEPMDWSPSVPQASQHRAFLPSTRDSKSKLFGDSPINGQNSTFWFKVPPAPTTPAQKRYNPPNQARLLIKPQETNENFFNAMNRRVSNPNVGELGVRNGDSINPAENFEFAQPKFFPPTPPCKETDELVRLFANSWTLSDEEKKIPELVKRHGSRARNGVHAFSLILGFVLWHYSEMFPSAYSKHFMTAAMILTVYISEEIIRNNHSNIENSTGPTKGQVVGITIGISALLVSGFMIANIWFERSYSTNISSHGHWLIAALWLHQFWLALFGH